MKFSRSKSTDIYLVTLLSTLALIIVGIVFTLTPETPTIHTGTHLGADLLLRNRAILQTKEAPNTKLTEPQTQENLKVRMPSSNQISTSAEESVDILAGAELISFNETKPDGNRQFLRTKIFRTTFKYPLVRLQESMQRESDGNEHLLEQSVSVADHVLIRLKPGSSGETLTDSLAQYNATIRKVMPLSGLIIVAFDGTNPNALDQAIQHFGNLKDGIASVSVDTIIQLQ